METLKIVCPECSSVNSVVLEAKTEITPCFECKTDLDDPFPIEVSDESCSIHIANNEVPILVDFYSTTCPPCMAMYEDYEDAALGFSMNVRFLKVNVDKYQETAKKYGVGGVPTIIAFKGAEEVNRISRQLSRVELTMWAESLLEN